MSDAQPYDQSAKGSHDLRCPQCQLGQLDSRHCKRLCEQCGYVENCKDIFPSQEPARSDSEHHRMYVFLNPVFEESVRERFYAISVEKKVKHPAVLAIADEARQKLFG